MDTTIETITIQDLLARAQMLSEAGRLRLAALLGRILIPVPRGQSAEEINALAKQLEREGIL